MKKIIKILFSVSLILVVPFLIFTLITSNTDAIGRIRSFVVLTGSMEPSIPVGSIIYIQRFNTYKTGSIISFKNTAGQTITHRIVERITKGEQLFYKTKGDANKNADDTLVAQKDVIGRKELVIPYIGRFIVFLKTLPGFITFIFIPILLYVAYELNTIKNEFKKGIERKVMERMQTT